MFLQVEICISSRGFYRTSKSACELYIQSIKKDKLDLQL